MRPANFEYFSPSTVQEAALLLEQSDGGGRVIAGGQSLMPAMNLRLSKPTRLVDLLRIEGLAGIDIDQSRARFGALTRHADIIGHDALHQCLPIFREAGRHIAHATIREHGTIGGSMALADPAAEWATVLTLLGARLLAVSSHAERWIPIEEFLVSYYTTALSENEILTAIEVPLPTQPRSFGFMEFSRQAGAFALAMVAVEMGTRVRDEESLKVCVGACSSRPLIVPIELRRGEPPSADDVDAAFEAIGLAPSGDIHASAEDRKQIANALVRRCITETLARRAGERNEQR